MHGLLFYFQYVPQERCDFTVHNFSLVWLRNCYIASRPMRNPGFFSLVCTSQQKLDTNFTFFFSKYPTTVQCYASFVSLLVADWIVSGASRLSSLLVHCLCGFGLDNRSSSDIIEARRPSGINLY